jgi:TonB family protein
MGFWLVAAAAAAVSTAQGPHWLSKPTAEDIVQAYPPKALKKSVEGKTLLQCKVRPDGWLTDCVAEEDPINLGFGSAALTLVPKFQMSTLEDGTSTAGGIIRIPIYFKPAPKP